MPDRGILGTAALARLRGARRGQTKYGADAVSPHCSWTAGSWGRVRRESDGNNTAA